MDASKPRKQRDTSQKREAILDGAIRAFRDFGYETVSMDQIAEKSGASKRTLYNHFSSKEDLLQAIIKRYLESQQAIKVGIIYRSDEALSEQLARFIDAELYLVNAPERQVVAKVLTSIFMWNSELAIKTRKSYNLAEAPMFTWLEAAAADGRIKIRDFKQLTEQFHALVQGFLTWPALFMPELNNSFISEKKKMVIELFLGLVQVDDARGN